MAAVRLAKFRICGLLVTLMCGWNFPLRMAVVPDNDFWETFMRFRPAASIAAIPLVWLALTGSALSQTAPGPGQANPATVPAIELSQAQRQTIFQSVSNGGKNNAAPPGFRVAVGENVPNGIELAPVSNTLTTLIPATDGLEVAMIEKQVVLVDPKTKRIIAVVVHD
jgi:hypothetical protein